MCVTPSPAALFARDLRGSGPRSAVVGLPAILDAQCRGSSRAGVAVTAVDNDETRARM
jgi:hypothetical protein